MQQMHIKMKQRHRTWDLSHLCCAQC